MSICRSCEQEMLTANTCVRVPIPVSKNVELDPVMYGDEKRFGEKAQAERCPDCNVRLGGYHHPGCDWEECPKCRSQVISCGCVWVENEHSDEHSEKEKP